MINSETIKKNHYIISKVYLLGIRMHTYMQLKAYLKPGRHKSDPLVVGFCFP